MPKGKYKHTPKSKAIHNVRKFFPKVTRVNDATKAIEIEVTEHDDKVARKKDHAECAMAVACKRKLHADGVIISRSVAYVVKGTEATRYKVPESVSREVVSFDRGGGFGIGTYELKVPDYNLGEPHSGGHDSKSPLTHSGGLAKRFRHITTGVRTELNSKDA
jgi:hypothetical protein